MPVWVQDYIELYKTYDMYADLMENGPKVLGVIVVRYLHLKLGFMPKWTQTLCAMCKWSLCSQGYNNDEAYWYLVITILNCNGNL